MGAETRSPAAARRLELHWRIFIGLAAGALAGGAANRLIGVEDKWALAWFVNNVTGPAGAIFLRLLLMIVLPLVFSSLTLGVAGMGDLRRFGRVGLKTLGFTLILSSLSVVIGLALVNAIEPGKQLSAETREELMNAFGADARRTAQQLGPAPSGLGLLVGVVPDNPLAAMARNPPDMLGVMFFALIFGLALILIAPEQSKPVLQLLEGIYGATAKIIELVMRLAPYGVFALLFTITASFGFGLLGTLGWFVGTVLAGLALQQFGVYSLVLRLLTRMNPLEFFARIKTVMLTAFSTSSSNATLPTALEVAQSELRLPREISSFVLTIGATANQNGTALHQGVTVLFLAQVFGLELTLAQQLQVVVLAVLAGVGTAGVPSGSIPFVVLILQQLGIPTESIALILGVDRILDMCRTTLNVTGDLVAAVYITNTEGLLPSPAVAD